MSGKKTCFECGEETENGHEVPNSTTIVMDDTEVFVWNVLCEGCFIAYSGFDNQGRPAIVQLYEAGN